MTSLLFEKPTLRSIGITRLGKLTELDTIGIPVWFACRPNSRCLSVTQGKGLTDEQAQISAFMEAAEYAFAENADPLVKHWGSASEMLAQNHRIIEISELSMFQEGQFDKNATRGWVLGKSLVSDAEILVPYEAVGMDMRVPSQWDSQSFRMSSVGLAAGFDRDHAIRHALFEVIENDATAPIETFGFRPSFLEVIPNTKFADENLRAVIAMLEAAGLKTEFHVLKSGTKYPVVGATVENASIASAGRYGGYAARECLDAAALAALLEAIQSRLTDVSGAREDISLPEFNTIAIPEPGRVFALPPNFNFQDAKQNERATISEIVERCLAAGAKDIVVVPLGGQDIGIEVVRVLAPGLDQAFEDGHNTLGINTLKALLNSTLGTEF